MLNIAICRQSFLHQLQQEHSEIKWDGSLPQVHEVFSWHPYVELAVEQSH
jgi:hypothetical protein